MAKTTRRLPPQEPIDYGMLTGLLGYRLRRAQAVVFNHFLNGVGKLGVSPGQLGVLVLIGENAGLSQSALAKALGIERSTMVAVIDRLEAQGWVARVTSEADRRSYALTLTKSGTDLLARVIPAVRAHERQIAARLSGREKALLIELLERIAGDGESE